jgi:BASS family bile acid:Na+ symporter
VGLVIGVLAILAGALPAIFSQAGEGAIAAMAAFVVVGLAVGHWLGGPAADHRPVLALSTASRHPAIALAIAKANFPDEPYLGAAIVLFLLVNLLAALPYLEATNSGSRPRRPAVATDSRGRRRCCRND